MTRRFLSRWVLAALAVGLTAALSAWAQIRIPAGPGAGGSSNAPLTFTADQVEYDRQHSLVIARGAVEAWQNDHVLRADEIIFNRDTGVAAARGNVVLLEPDGETLFAGYAELNHDMNNGVLKDMGALLADNGRMAANGARRTAGQINELSRVVYSSCDLCPLDPNKAPLWQLRANSAVQDLEHKVIEYHDVTLEIYGEPIAWFPYLAHPDPSVKRRSGVMIPYAGNSSRLGVFFGVPYYWVIDAQSDATITPTITTRLGPQIDVEYRRAFNTGTLLVNTSLGYAAKQAQGTIAARGQFSYNDTWRWGFDINRASSLDYLQAFHTGLGLAGAGQNLLPSTVYFEGFGQGSYSRIDIMSFQSLTASISDTTLPVVLPRYMYSYFGQPDAIGGRLTVDAGAFNVLRSNGTSTRRASLTANWERPVTGRLGDLWKLSLHGDAAAYDVTRLNGQPNFAAINRVNTARALPQIGLSVRWPFARDSGTWGTQLIEPMAELIVAPRGGNSQVSRIPNEDSLDFEFSDANLFGFNRFPGIDRLEGGTRLNAALHGAWYLGGTTFDGLIGQSYRAYRDDLFPAASGLRNQVSDIVARGTFAPTSWLDLTYRTRLDAKTMATRMVDAVASVGGPRFRVSGGYTYSLFDPYTYYSLPAPPTSRPLFHTPRNEASLAVSTNWGPYRFAAYARRDLTNNRMIGFGGDLIYEDECFILDLRFNRRYTTYLFESGATTVLLQFTFKTVGQFGYRAL